MLEHEATAAQHFPSFSGGLSLRRRRAAPREWYPRGISLPAGKGFHWDNAGPGTVMKHSGDFSHLWGLSRRQDIVKAQETSCPFVLQVEV